MTENEVLKWAQFEERWWQMLKSGELPPILSFGDLPECPEWALRDSEQDYRRGFRHGVVEAARMVWRLHQAGYVRPQEISNILRDWEESTLQRWSHSTLTEQPLKDFDHPRLKIRKWSEVKREVQDRDGGKCVECGSTQRLEAHHVDPVRGGGLPEPWNLKTLCKPCHSSL